MHLNISRASSSFLLVLLAAAWLAEPAPSFADTPSSTAGPALPAPSLRDTPAPYLAEIRTKAQQGDAASQFKLGGKYYKGDGVAQDYAEAAKWFGKAAEQGDKDAQFSLGVLCATGRGVMQDYVEAVKWYREAAEQDVSVAQFNLGGMYANGQGVTQDYADAARWYRKAAEQGYAPAQNNLGVLYRDGLGVTQDEAEAAKWIRKAAEQRNATALKWSIWCWFCYAMIGFGAFVVSVFCATKGIARRTKISFRQTTDVFPEVERWAEGAGFNFDPRADTGKLYRKGRGLLMVSMRLSVRQNGGVVEMEAWLPTSIFMRIVSLFVMPSEIGIESAGGFYFAAVPRWLARNAINRLLRQLGQAPIP